MLSRTALGLVLVAIASGTIALALHGRDSSSPAIEDNLRWQEIDWPFLRDGWPNGRAFACEGEGCGGQVILYARVKVGFCDCSRGVADDEDIDRVGDAELVDDHFTPMDVGRPRIFAGMAGRQRLYRGAEGGPAILVLAGGRNCNAFSGMAVWRGAFSPAAIDSVARFLDDPAMARWIAEKQGS